MNFGDGKSKMENGQMKEPCGRGSNAQPGNFYRPNHGSPIQSNQVAHRQTQPVAQTRRVEARRAKTEALAKADQTSLPATNPRFRVFRGSIPTSVASVCCSNSPVAPEFNPFQGNSTQFNLKKEKITA